MHRCLASWLVGLVMLLAMGGCSSEATQWSRHDFAAAFGRIYEGMPEVDVLAALGRPDDVRTQEDPGWRYGSDIKAVWNYGTDRHMGFATLGSVMIRADGHALVLSGTQGADGLVAKLGEKELRRLLRMVARMGEHRQGEWDPGDAIAAINALQPLGKETGVAVLREYLRVSAMQQHEEDCVLILLRGLFDVPAAAEIAGKTYHYPSGRDAYEEVKQGYFRRPMLGGSWWEPEDWSRLPRFPLVVVEDVPVVVVQGYSLFGQAESASKHLEYLELVGKWRSEPLRPTDDPLGLLEKIVAMLPAQAQADSSRVLIAEQLLRSIRTAYREPVKGEVEDNYRYREVLEAFEKARKLVRGMGIRWDAGRSCYVRADRTVLPQDEKVYRATEMEAKLSEDYELGVRVERENSKRVEVTFSRGVNRGSSPRLVVRVLRIGGQALAEGDMDPQEAPGGSVTPLTAYLAEGERLRVEVEGGGRRWLSGEILP